MLHLNNNTFGDVSYEEGVTAGEMLTQAQIDYLDNVGKDYFTIEEYLLLGDPSLMVGGYP